MLSDTPFSNSNNDRFQDECGVFGIFNHPEAANLVYLGLYALQHRGQEAAGIVSVEERILHVHRGRGLVADLFRRRELARLRGDQAIGHVRYSTSGKDTLQRNYQPLVADTAHGGIAIAHNGNLVDAVQKREALEKRGAIFQSTMDTEVIVHLTAISKRRGFAERLVDALHQVNGAYALVAMNEHRLIGARDAFGFRPLVLGRVGEKGYVLSSETCALDLIGATFVRDIQPGEVVVIDDDGLTSFYPFQKKSRAFCVFEYIYFARPDSTLDGINVYATRKKIGALLAEEHPVEADLVVPVPDSGVPSALGFAEKAGLSFDLGIIRNHYVGRTFIEPQQAIRHFGVKIKLNANRALFSGKRVILVDDSVVRGTTSQKIVTMVRAAGAREVHLRISSPPTIYPCRYGIDTPTKEELLASRYTVKEMCDYIKADSLAFISLENLYRAVNGSSSGFCDACFSGKYPIAFNDEAFGKQLTLLKEAG